MKKITLLKFLTLFFAGTYLSFAQNINGKIVDGFGDAVPYASVIEKGTTNGTSTDDGGNFILAVNSLPTTLVISSVGMLL